MIHLTAVLLNSTPRDKPKTGLDVPLVCLQLRNWIDKLKTDSCRLGKNDLQAKALVAKLMMSTAQPGLTLTACFQSP